MKDLRTRVMLASAAAAVLTIAATPAPETRYYPLTPREKVPKKKPSKLKRWDPLESTCRHASLSIL